MNEEERVREKIWLVIQEGVRDKESYDVMVNQILSLDGIRIEADDQNEGIPLEPLGPDAARTWKVTITNMLNPDKEGKHWVRVIPKPKRK